MLYEIIAEYRILPPTSAYSVSYTHLDVYKRQDDSLLVYTGYKEENGEAHLHVSVKIENRFAEKRGTFSLDEPDFERQCGLAMAVLLYDILVELTGYRPKWGVLIGVRPIKLLRKLTAEMGQSKAADYFLNSLHVSQEKTALSVRTMQHEQPIRCV